MLENGTAVKRLHNLILYSDYKENDPCFYYYYELALPLTNELEKRLHLLKRNRIRTSAAYCGVHHTCKSIN